MRAAKEEVWMWWQESVAWTERCLEWQRGLPKNVTFIIIIFLTVLSIHCGERASLVVVRGLSCPTARGILVPRPGIEPASPVLEGRFFTTGPPGKS